MCRCVYGLLITLEVKVHWCPTRRGNETNHSLHMVVAVPTFWQSLWFLWRGGQVAGRHVSWRKVVSQVWLGSWAALFFSRFPPEEGGTRENVFRTASIRSCEIWWRISHLGKPHDMDGSKFVRANGLWKADFRDPRLDGWYYSQVTFGEINSIFIQMIIQLKWCSRF